LIIFVTVLILIVKSKREITDLYSCKEIIMVMVSATGANAYHGVVAARCFVDDAVYY